MRLVRHCEGDEFGPDRTSGPFLYRAPAALAPSDNFLVKASSLPLSVLCTDNEVAVAMEARPRQNHFG